MNAGWIGLVSVLLSVAFYLGMRYGLKLESDAYAELHKLKFTLAKMGVSTFTILTADAARVHSELVRAMKLPQSVVGFVENTIRMELKKFHK